MAAITRFQSHIIENSENSCSICLEIMHPQDNLAAHKTPEIYHIFHRDCIQKSIATKAECPLCREPATIALPFSQRFKKVSGDIGLAVLVGSAILTFLHLNFAFPRAAFFVYGSLACATCSNLARVVGLVAAGILSEVYSVSSNHWGYAFSAGVVAYKAAQLRSCINVQFLFQRR